ncbi:hypothetical protein OG562_20230 [Streptomyces sp. NBC_01275]|uniref:hypothetical protein n=1 Tax=Streptomyces sp. NBC_01275 TaxID=2903807 RepID=UPI0022589F6B|nr:hypothetical protein [Streptomyces sp. NBC_01275]MCX4763254.1 hypothetical protein [Streptomyces sp. NBC_01275]
MTKTINDDLVVSGSLSAANILFGSVEMSPQENTATSMEVKTNHVATNEPVVLLTAHSAYPWTRVREVGYRFATQTGFTAYIFRTNDVATTVHWLSWQEFTP